MNLHLAYFSKRFEDLTKMELYELLQLRNEVFIVEQNCPYLDVDGHDQKGIHVLGYLGDSLLTYSRIINDDNKVKIGRVIVHKSYRNKNLGSELMQFTIRQSKQLFPKKEIHLAAQLYLKAFYMSLGFRVVSSPYDWDGIQHIDMKL